MAGGVIGGGWPWPWGGLGDGSGGAAGTLVEEVVMGEPVVLQHVDGVMICWQHNQPPRHKSSLFLLVVASRDGIGGGACR